MADLEQSILKQDPALAWSPRPPRRGHDLSDRSGPPNAPAPTCRSTPHLDGSTAACSRLGPVMVLARGRGHVRRDDARSSSAPGWPVDGPSAGEQLLMLITGEPGIGKTRLTAEIARECDAAGDLVLHGRWDEEPLCPSQAFREALSRYALRAPEGLVRGRRRRAGSRAWRASSPRSSRASRAPPRPSGAEAESDRYQVFDAVDRWIRAIADRRRLVLVLDDMHWADRPVTLLLEYLLRSSTPAPLLIVATYRQTDSNVAGWFSESLAGIRRTTSVENIALAGLSAAETQELLEAAIGRTLERPTRPRGRPTCSGTRAATPSSCRRWCGTCERRDDHSRPGRWRTPRSSCCPSGCATSCGGAFVSFPTSACVSCRPHRRWATSSTSPRSGCAIDCDEETLLLALDEARLAGVVTESSRAIRHPLLHPRRRAPGPV